MDMKKQINMCLFIFMRFLLIEIKFEVDINNDELLETISEDKEKRELIITNSVKPKLVMSHYICIRSNAYKRHFTTYFCLICWKE
jgi:hypothetical protein